MLWLLLLAGLVGEQPALDAREGDLEIFTEVSRVTVREYEARHFIDPRLLDLSEEGAFPDTSRFVAGESATGVQSRKEVLEAIGVDTAPAIPVRDDCDGLLFPEPRNIDGCPKEWITHSVFSPPIKEGEYATVRRFSVSYGPRGRSATLSELTLVSNSETWTVIEVERLVAWD